MPRLSRRNVRKGGKGRKGKGGMFPQQPMVSRSDSFGQQPAGQSVPRTTTLGQGPFPSKCQKEEDALKACERGESTSSGFMSGMGGLFGSTKGGRKSRRRGRKSQRRGRKSRRRGRKSRRRSRR
jgi:hypothetical protein